MRYTRLRRAIESGTLIGTHGTPFQGAAEKETGHQKRRKVPLLSARNEGTADLSPMHTRSGYSYERKTKLEEAPANGSVSDGTSADDERTPTKKRTKISSHIDHPPKPEGCSSESTSPALSHKPTAESGTAGAAKMDSGSTDHPSFTTSNDVDRLLSKMATPETDPNTTPTPLNNLGRGRSSEGPGAGDSSRVPVDGARSQALCSADEKQVNHAEVQRSAQSVKDEDDEAGPTLKAEGSQAVQNVKYELYDCKSPQH
ncbi:MAG: hypothetical protein LQ347_000600 [Umbilicaria vellea]|nr:MAG: hypothetical protein LQ347_000600 [Umbilicaria vellea]